MWLLESSYFALVSVCLSLFSCLFFLSLPSALQQEVAETELQGDLALHLPPCNADADRPENVYLFDDRILFFLCVYLFVCQQENARTVDAGTMEVHKDG